MFNNSQNTHIAGGTFTVNNNFKTQSQLLPKPWDRLKDVVAPAAIHNSAERFDPPRCHPNTRVAIMDELIDWVIRRGNSGGSRVLWLSGPAGAGKSAIAQSLSEVCFSQKFLLASFFFNRSDSSRNNPKLLVATITSQIYEMVPQQYKALILDAIENNPLVFNRSVEAQFKALIMDPLRNLFEVDYFNNYNAPRLIVIDGLDECSTPAAQVNILNAVQTISTHRSSPFVFLIASRPENHIQMFFQSSGLGSLIHRLDLDNSYLPDLDIELFLKEKLGDMPKTHPLKSSIPPEWPPSGAIKKFVDKSSGQFIYASVVVKYVTSSRHYPPSRLEVVLGLRPPRRDLPFSELDALYSHILSSVEDINLVLQTLRMVVLFQYLHVWIGRALSSNGVEELCELEQGECLDALGDLQSILQIDPTNHTIYFLHKSLSDYLVDPSRSHVYYIDTSPKVIACTLVQCLRVISGPKKQDIKDLCKYYITTHNRIFASQIQICCQGLMSFDVTRSVLDGSRGHTNKFWELFNMLDGLYTLIGTDYEYVYRHQLYQFAEGARHYFLDEEMTPNVWHSWPMIMVFVLLGNSKVHIPSEVFDILHSLDGCANLRQFHPSLHPDLIRRYKNLSYAVAQHCIHSLAYDQYSHSAAFALECLLMTLPHSKLSADLNDACNTPGGILAYSSSGRSLTYNSIGRSCTEMGCTVAEMTEMTEELELSARKAMRDYTERYAKGEIPDDSDKE